MTITHTFQDAVKSVSNRLATLPQRLRPHALPLSVLMLVTLISIISISLGTRIDFDVDSPSYYDLANQYFRGHIISIFRTPGYPLFLKMVFLFTGKNNFNAVIVAQMALMLLTIVEIYFLMYRVLGKRWAAVIIAALVGVNVDILAWGWSILTESLAFWSGVTAFLLFERYIKTERPAYLISLGLMLFVTILIRPIFIYLPPMMLIFLLIWSWRNHKIRWQWKHLILIGVLTYIPLLGYMGILRYKTGFFGVSEVSNVNLVEKIMEYRMQTLPGSPQYADLQQRMIAYYNAGEFFKSGPWQFVLTEPGVGVGWSRAGALCLSIIEHHPVEYISATIADAQHVWLAPPVAYTTVPSNPLNQVLKPFAASMLWVAYALLPLTVLFFLVLTWRRRNDLTALMMLLLSLVVSAGIFTVAADATEQFYRLRFPMDWGAIVVTGVALYMAITMLVRKITGASSAPATEASSADGELLETVKRPAIPSRSRV